VKPLDPQCPTAALLLAAYSKGVFPMADPERGEIDWYEVEPRGVLPLDSFHVPRTLARLVRQQRFEIRVDSAVSQVIGACAGDRSASNRGWMSAALRHAYEELAALGHCHSVEAWLKGHLVGGLYGVRLGGAFFGESMFARPERGGSNASKVCLVHLVERLRAGGFRLLDTQMVTSHMEQFGAIEIPARTYRALLKEALASPAQWDSSGSASTRS